MSIYVHVKLSVCLSVCVLNLSLLLLPQASGCRTPNSSQAPPIPLIPPYPSLPIPYLTHFTMSRRTMRLSHFHVILSVNLVATNASRLLNKKPRPLPACLPSLSFTRHPTPCSSQFLLLLQLPALRIDARNPCDVSVKYVCYASHICLPRPPLTHSSATPSRPRAEKVSTPFCHLPSCNMGQLLVAWQLPS